MCDIYRLHVNDMQEDKPTQVTHVLDVQAMYRIRTVVTCMFSPSSARHKRASGIHACKSAACPERVRDITHVKNLHLHIAGYEHVHTMVPIHTFRACKEGANSTHVWNLQCVSERFLRSEQLHVQNV